MANMTDLERIKLIYSAMVGGILLLAVLLATLMIMWQVQDNRQIKQVTERLNLDAGDGL